MKQLVNCADEYIRQCRIKDFALLKVCLCALGVMIGLSVPEKKRKWPLAAAGFVFMFSYAMLMAEFLKIYMDER
ncbi:permease of phosphate ABC transporter [Clostridium boliviensis]|uniref:Permease of phosphate ABC transporter n=1 Tax=Clostridium boliviensis TaxID=318465 RepID=A0ABU4GWI3_9CLOT|nr:permease of phosphate ABC transporter [Clostridium boliviensis]MDW2800577.1 permease of phosphate ABC transporter [Clostridium boliviensis]